MYFKKNDIPFHGHSIEELVNHGHITPKPVHHHEHFKPDYEKHHKPPCEPHYDICDVASSDAEHIAISNMEIFKIVDDVFKLRGK